MATRLLIGMITFYILATLICNVGEGQAMAHSIDTDMEGGLGHNTVQSTDALGATTTFWTATTNTLALIWKVVWFDYSVFKDVDPATGDPVANDWAIVRYMLIAIGIAIVIDFIVVLRSISK
jgi:hypothetical protein